MAGMSLEEEAQQPVAPRLSAPGTVRAQVLTPESSQVLPAEEAPELESVQPAAAVHAAAGQRQAREVQGPVVRSTLKVAAAAAAGHGRGKK